MLGRAAMATLEETRPSGEGRARGLVSGRQSGSRIDARTFAPPDDLAPLVESFWVGRWELPDDAPHTTRLLGDPCLHVILEVGARDELAERLVGVWTRRWENTLAGRGTVRAAKLKAGAGGALLDDASRVRNRRVPLRELFDGAPSAAGLPLEAEGDDEAFERLAAFLRRRLRPTPDTEDALVACDLLRREDGLLRVDQLATAMDRSERALQRLFKAQVGAPPKFVIRRHRLQEAAVRLERGDALSLADLALDLGYADQAHFARDWKTAVGQPASRFARAVHEE